MSHDVLQVYHIENVAAEVHDNEDGADKIHRVGHDQVVVVEAHETDMSQNVVAAAVAVVAAADPNEMGRCCYWILDGDEPIANDLVVVVHALGEVVHESCNIVVKTDNILYCRRDFQTCVFRRFSERFYWQKITSTMMLIYTIKSNSP